MAGEDVDEAGSVEAGSVDNDRRLVMPDAVRETPDTARSHDNAA